MSTETREPSEKKKEEKSKTEAVDHEKSERNRAVLKPKKGRRSGKGRDADPRLEVESNSKRKRGSN